MSLTIALAAPFRHARKERLKKNEIIYYLAFDRHWMNIEQANSLISRAAEEGLIEYEGDMIKPAFDVSQVEIPIGFKPSSAIFERSDPYQDLLGRIVSECGHSAQVVVSEMNSLIQKEFDGNLRPEAAIVIVAKKYGVGFEDMLPALRDQIQKR
ncbi:MAG: DUF2240 family protein [Methanoregulaceae archaeon]|jgi:hypothetical protein|nr:DUF2240 family protein [Methanoregulaceae archaeon]